MAQAGSPDPRPPPSTPASAAPAAGLPFPLGADLVGRTIGGHRIDGLLGQGGMGAVYKAFDAALDRHVAVKIIRPELAHGPMLDRFLREARALAHLNHPNLLAIHSIGAADALGGIPYFVMEFIEGRSLADHLRDAGALPVDEVAALCGQVLSALDHVHGEGITHRDLKPSNIMLRADDDRAILMDFGIAKVEDAQGLTTEGIVLGTPEYMSPEQADGAQADPRSDIYSFGIMMYEMVSGAVPFRGKSTFSILRQQVEAPPAPLGERCPAQWEAVIFRCIEKRPQDRFPSAPHLACALAALHPTPALTDLAGRADRTVQTRPVMTARPDAKSGAAGAEAPLDQADTLPDPVADRSTQTDGGPIGKASTSLPATAAASRRTDRNGPPAGRARLLLASVGVVILSAMALIFWWPFGRGGALPQEETNDASRLKARLQSTPAGKILFPGAEPIPGKILSVMPNSQGGATIRYWHNGRIKSRDVKSKFEIDLRKTDQPEGK